MAAHRTTRIAEQDRLDEAAGLRDGCITPAVYGDIESEYRCVRERVGVQDLGHCAKISVAGTAAVDLVNYLILTDLVRLPINQMQASFMLDEAGRVVCEVQIINAGTHYLLIAEGAPAPAVLARIEAAQSLFPGCTVEDRTEALGLLSVDGPYAWELLKTFLGLGVIGIRYLEVVPGQSIGGVTTTLCRAGKTGEYGYLLLCDAAEVARLWAVVREAGAPFDLLPIGYSAVDLCKMENRVVSPYREGSAAANALELNTRVMFARHKGEHLGRAALEAVVESGVARRLVGLRFGATLPQDRAGLAPGATVRAGEAPIGTLVNAGYSYSLATWIGLAMLDEPYACVGIDYAVDTQDGAEPAQTVSAPFLFNRSLGIRPQEDSYFA